MAEAGRMPQTPYKTITLVSFLRKKLYILGHSGLDKPAPYLIRGGNDDSHPLQPTCPRIFLKDEANSTSGEDIPPVSSLS